MDLNKFSFTANLTRNPELRHTPSGHPVSSFPVAINYTYKQGEKLRDEVCYIDLVAFGRTAELCSEKLKKGSPVAVDGRLQQRRWEDENGQKRSKHEVVVQQIKFLVKKETREKAHA